MQIFEITQPRKKLNEIDFGAVKAPAAPAVEQPRVPPGGFMVPKEVVLKNPTPADREANAVWNIRAALNGHAVRSD